ncbi:uncharacterized protein LOC130136788 [Syzygium oleosum]|uniref:uncharacterized protein LOC130136788 n=1 Tax=Syzygium oleosum TaxID=219896 RepID=UPI0024BAE87C|nr:uncharacterized protein LOC130136788 [Syzygium oleosum]
MVIDAAGQNVVSDPNHASTSTSFTPTLEQLEEIGVTGFDENVCNETFPSNQFWEVLKAADEPLWAGCDNHTQLSVTARLLNIKAEHNVSENCFNSFVEVMRETMPRDNIMPSDFYDMKKLVDNLGLPVERIDICSRGCMLYWRDDENAESCKFCSQPRYKINRRHGRNQKRRPCKQMFYLPLIPRLQRLYASQATAEHMTWHANHETEEGLMCHPSDAEAWKHFDRTYPEFAIEPRNIRLGLCADGFAPFGKSGKSYSCWPVILTPYNLPPGMCMKTPYMFLTLIVTGPQNPKKLIDVYMQPLIEELQRLWNEGSLRMMFLLIKHL